MPQPANPISLQPRGHYSTDYQLVLENGLTIEDAEKPEFWSKICARPDQFGKVKLRRFDRIQVIPEDETCFAEFVVLAAGVGFARVKRVLLVEMETFQPSELPRTTRVEHQGFGKWRVIRISDGAKLKEGLASRGEAERCANDYERVTAKAA